MPRQQATPTGWPRLVLELVSPVWASGRVGTVLRWMQWLAGTPVRPALPGGHGPWRSDLCASRSSQRGRAMGRGGRARAVRRALPDGSSVAGTLAYLRANLAREGWRDAERRPRGLGGLDPASPFRATMVHLQGVSHLLEGDLDRADAHLAHAWDLATAFGSTPLMSLILAERSRGRDRAQRPAGRRLLRAARAPRWWTRAASTATGPAPWSSPQPPDPLRTRRHARGAAAGPRAHELRPLLTYALPVVSVQALVELARAYLGFADHGGAAAR